MTRPLLPPRGLFVKTETIFNLDIAPVLLVTWIRLRALAYGRSETPALSISEISNIVGISSSVVYGHMASLRDKNALRWRSLGDGTIIVSFTDDETLGGDTDSEKQESLVNIKVLNPESEFNYDSSESKNLATIENVMSLYREVTGHFTFPPGQYMTARLEIIQGLLKAHGYDGAKERLVAAWDDWRTKRRKDSGVPYSAINTAWIDYTMTAPMVEQAQAVNPDGSLNV